MRETDLDIMEIIISNMKEETEIQGRIKTYMKTHKNNCNHFIYAKYEREATYFNAILKSIMSDLGSEVLRTLQSKDLV